MLCLYGEREGSFLYLTYINTCGRDGQIFKGTPTVTTFAIQQTDSIQQAGITHRGRSHGMALRTGTASPVVAAWSHVAHEIAPQVAELKDDALDRRLADSTTKHVLPAFKSEQVRIQAEYREQAARMVKLTSGEGLDGAQKVADAHDFKVLSATADQLRWIAAGSRDMLAAVFSGERARFAGVSDQTWQAGVARLARLTFIQQAGVQARFPIKPTAENPAIIGADLKAAEAFADQAFNAFDAEIAATKHAERGLRDALQVIAIAMDLPTADAALALVQAA